MNRLATTDLAAMFDIEFVDCADVGALQDTAATSEYRNTLCSKCKGKGKFLSYSGRVVGPCFTCNGTGLSHLAAVATPEGGCAKCAGTGEWRPGRPCFTCDGTGKADRGQTAAAISVARIEQSFAAAQANGIKRPKLRLDTFTFSLAPVTGRNAGSLYVKEGETYLGKVTGGTFHAVRDCDAETRTRIVCAAANPDEAAKAYGQKTGSCSCCGRTLTDKDSIAMSIGPICRAKFGWGG